MWHSCYWYKLLRNEKAMQITLLVSFSVTQPFLVIIQFKVVIGIWGMPQGAKSGGDMESAQAKNKALENAGAIVPTSFEGLEGIIKATYEKLVEKKVIVPVKDYTPPPVPEDLNSAIKSGKVRAPTHIVSTICDDRGEEPSYAGVAMSTIIEKEYGVGDVISLLWFKRSLPHYCTKFIEVTACFDMTSPCSFSRNDGYFAN
jgi:hypothetical protein